jgi:hypothetical protein
MVKRSALLCVGLLMAASAPSAPNGDVVGVAAARQTTPAAGRWQYIQFPDREGEVLDLFVADGRWRGIMNGLERTGDHGLFYYVVEVEQLAVDPDGTIRFEVSERSLFDERPPLSQLGGVGSGGLIRSRMRFSGRIEGGVLILRCADDDGSCPDATLHFKA